MKTELWVFIFLIFKSSPLKTGDLVNEWIIWNVGQGQWVSHIQNDRCRHYDVGGELGSYRVPQKKLQTLCLNRENQIAISHWDFDHYAQMALLAKSVAALCWLSRPQWIENKKSVRTIRELKIPDCFKKDVQAWRPKKYHNLNDSSGVFVDEEFLLPGDSPMNQEKIWIHKLRNLAQIQVLILGHHGSRTSTSPLLLQTLPRIKMAVASARYAKYRHPHFSTLKRLHQYNIPTLRTEDWGHLHFKY